MSDRWWNDAERDETHQAAADWFASLQRADISPEELLAWQRWLAASPRNAEAFARLEEVCALMRTVGADACPTALQVPGGAYDGNLPISEWKTRARRHSWIGIAASLVVGLVLVSWIALEKGTFWNGETQSIQTGVGENRTIHLADGSRVTLGGDTQLATRFTATRREIELSRGEAYFAVAKDRTRPFWVLADDTLVTAIGTEFNVRRRESHVAVTVIEGQVLVEPSMPNATGRQTSRTARSARVKVSAGEKVVIGAAAVQPVHVENTGAVVAWRSGQLIFDREPLRNVVEDVNRYSPKPVAIEDPDIGDLMFTGTVMNGNVKGWLFSIERIFALDAAEEPDRIVLRRGNR